MNTLGKENYWFTFSFDFEKLSFQHTAMKIPQNLFAKVFHPRYQKSAQHCSPLQSLRKDNQQQY